MVLNKKGQVGIGTLIVFIAMILVAAIAASVLIQTATSLQSRALSVGSRTEDEVSSAIQVISVYGENGSNNYLNNFSVKIKLAPSSGGIDMGETMVEVSLHDDSSDLSLDTTERNCANGAGVSGTYEIDTLVGTDDDFLERGEIAMLCFNAPRNVLPDEKVTFKVTPTAGIPIGVSAILPTVVADQRIYLYP